MLQGEPPRGQRAGPAASPPPSSPCRICPPQAAPPASWPLYASDFDRL